MNNFLSNNKNFSGELIFLLLNIIIKIEKDNKWSQRK